MKLNTAAIALVLFVIGLICSGCSAAAPTVEDATTTIPKESSTPTSPPATVTTTSPPATVTTTSPPATVTTTSPPATVTTTSPPATATPILTSPITDTAVPQSPTPDLEEDQTTPDKVSPDLVGNNEIASPEILDIDTQIEIVELVRRPLPPAAYSNHQTDQYARGLVFDEYGNLWVLMADGYVRWNTVTGDYAWAQPSSAIAAYVPPYPSSYCENLAGDLGLDEALFLHFTDCLHSLPYGSSWFATASIPFLGEGDGIYMFDGNTWEHFTTSEGLPSDDVWNLLIDNDGMLWARTQGAVSSFDSKGWTNYFGQDDPVASGMAIDAAGELWVGRKDGQLILFDGDEWTEHDIGIQDEAVSEILTDSFGGLWIPDWPMLYINLDGNWQAMEIDWPNDIPYSFTINDLDRSAGGQVWIATDSGVLHVYEGDVAWYGTGDGLADDHVADVTIGPDDWPWFATSGGVSHFDGNGWQTFIVAEGPGISYPMSAFADESGRIWFGGIDGVASLRDSKEWERYPELAGSPVLVNFVQSPAGELLGAGCSGVHKFDGDSWQLIPERSDESSLFWCATRLAVAPDGSIWVNSMDIPQDNGWGAVRITDNGVETYDLGYVTDILPQDDGAVWFGTREGVFVHSDGKWAILPDEVYDGMPWITAATMGPKGAAWFGTPLGFARFDGESWTSYQMADETQLDIFAINFDNAGVAWISILDGIGRFDGEKLVLYEYGDVSPFMIENPELYGMSIAGIVDSIAFGSDNTLWMPGGPRGIVRIDLQSLP